MFEVLAVDAMPKDSAVYLSIFVPSSCLCTLVLVPLLTPALHSEVKVSLLDDKEFRRDWSGDSLTTPRAFVQLK